MKEHTFYFNGIKTTANPMSRGDYTKSIERDIHPEDCAEDQGYCVTSALPSNSDTITYRTWMEKEVFDMFYGVRIRCSFDAMTSTMGYKSRETVFTRMAWPEGKYIKLDFSYPMKPVLLLIENDNISLEFKASKEDMNATDWIELAN